MNTKPKLRVALLVGSDEPSTRLSVESVCALPNIEPVALLLHTEQVGVIRRLRNLRRNVRKHGWKYVPFRIVEAARIVTDGIVERAVVSRDEVRGVLRKAFPGRCFTLSELSGKYGFRIEAVRSLNAPEAVRVLTELNVDLGIVIDTGILKETIFTVPRMGCINLHKGSVPDYSGQPPGFWELHNGARSAVVTVHFVDEGLQTGDVIATSEVQIRDTDTPVSLQQKLDEEGARTLAAAVTSIQAGTVNRRPQPQTNVKPRAKPTLDQIRELRRKLPHWSHRDDLAVLLKNFYCLLVYYSGLYLLVRTLHRLSKTRAAVIVFHRVNDFSKDVLTVDSETFTAQLLALSRRYPRTSTIELVTRIRNRQKIVPTTIVIHFDDCYRDVCTTAAPILTAAGFSAAAFVSSGFVGTERVFPHDLQRFPFAYANLRSGDIHDWLGRGFEIGSHTVNHVDLGSCSTEEARYEIAGSLAQLEAVTRQPVKYFAFPFGRLKNIKSETEGLVRQAGYTAMFSAYGGFVGPKTKLYDIPRIGCSGEVRPLCLLLEVECLTPNQIILGLKRALTRKRRKTRVDAGVLGEPVEHKAAIESSCATTHSSQLS
jgi:peptidoglycan/xylan/chitin deacetylase (PgdA/CDA1 family)